MGGLTILKPVYSGFSWKTTFTRIFATFRHAGGNQHPVDLMTAEGGLYFTGCWLSPV
jgi:hypothetical protein